MQRPYRILDLFAGIGGLSYGFEMVQPNGNKAFELVCAVEIDTYACDTFRINLEKRGLDPSVVLQADLTDPLTHRLIMEKCRDGVDIIVGGPPCQSFSHIGPRCAKANIRQKWENDPRDLLYLEYINLVKDLNPSFLVFENVKGILTKKDEEGQRYINRIVQSMYDCGYSTKIDGEENDYIIINAADYGVPQTRERVFILANNRGCTVKPPIRAHSQQGQIEDTLPWVTLWEAIGDLPPVQADITPWGLTERQKKRLAATNHERYRGEEEAPYHWDRFYQHYENLTLAGQRFLDFISPDFKDTKLTAHVARGQQSSDIQFFERLPEGMSTRELFRSNDPKLLSLRKYVKYDMNSFKDKYRKQSWSEPCTTIFAHMQKDGNRFIHPDSSQARTLTVREAARIQCFPDNFVFTAPGNVRYHYIGNAVPPLMAKAVATSVYNALESEKKPDIEIRDLVL